MVADTSLKYVLESNFSIIGNVPPKDVSFSDFICIFAMPNEVLFDYFCNTKLSESSDIAKIQGCSALPLGLSKNFLLLRVL